MIIQDYFIDNKKVNFKEEKYKKFLNGIAFDVESTTDSIVRIYLNGNFVGLGKVENKKLKRFIIE